MAKRIINAKPQLEPLLKPGESYLIGFGVKSLTTEGIHYRDLTELIKGSISDILIMGKKGPLKENIVGKYVRKQPENKEQVSKHIKYTRKDGRLIEYDRIFDMWEKELLHKFNLKLYKGVSPQGETILFFGNMKYDPDDKLGLLKAKAAMNIAMYLGNFFQVYDEKLEPKLKISGTFARKVLSKGFGTIREKLESIKESYFGDGSVVDNTGNSYRFSVLKDYEITDIYNGEGGFNEYLHFEFAKDNIVILENLRSGNATFIFDLSQYDKSIVLDKTTAQNHKSFKGRIIHHNIDKWKTILSGFLKEKEGDEG